MLHDNTYMIKGEVQHPENYETDCVPQSLKHHTHEGGDYPGQTQQIHGRLGT